MKYDKLVSILEAIREGYDFEVYEVSGDLDDQPTYFIVTVDNPDFKEDDGSTPKNAFDVAEVYKL